MEVDDEIKNEGYEKQVDEYTNVNDCAKSSTEDTFDTLGNEAVNGKSIWDFQPIYHTDILLRIRCKTIKCKIYPLCICNFVSLASLSGQFWAEYSPM